MFRSQQRAWGELRRRHCDWATRFVNGPDPVYALPEVVIAELEREVPRHNSCTAGRRLIDPDEAAAERAFTEYCEGARAAVAGVWHDRPVYSNLLVEPEPLGLTPEEFEAYCWGQGGMTYESCLRELDDLNRRAATYAQQCLGWAGYVTFNDEYRNELRRLRNIDRHLGGLIEFPLTRGAVAPASWVYTQALPTTPALSLVGAATRLLQDATSFLRRW
ncbi:MAG TPA: hypothetical protein VKE74_26125, partial [Gemmataceae bacterium]|nr:hypothetical protein [Gemmataceae bacterium]